MSDLLRVLALATYPDLAAATRHRVVQYVPLLAQHGITVDVRPFLTNETFTGMYDRRKALRTVAGVLAAIGRRTLDAARLSAYDLLLVQREAAPIGPPVVEWLAGRRMPLVLDLDDATYIRQESVWGKLTSPIRPLRKTEQLVRWANHVICGNPTLAAYATQFGKDTTVLPTIVDIDEFVPREAAPDGTLVIGWIGTHSTFEYLKTLFPVFRRLAAQQSFRLRIIGSGSENVQIPGVEVESLPWRLDRELDDLQSFDVAVYPIVDDEWARGKSGFKAIQYLSCGIPYVAAPVGVVAEIGEPGVTHYSATSEGQWLDALSRLLTDAEVRRQMAISARRYAVQHFSVRDTASAFASVLRRAVQRHEG